MRKIWDTDILRSQWNPGNDEVRDKEKEKDLRIPLFLTSDWFLLEKCCKLADTFDGEHLINYCWVLERSWVGNSFRNLDIEHFATLNISLWDSMWGWIILLEFTNCMTSYGIKSQSLERKVTSSLSCSYF